MQTDRVAVEIDERSATVTLSDPDRRNALDLGFAAEIEAVFDFLEADDNCRAAVVTGAPPAFCAGADLSHLGAAATEGLRDIYRSFTRIAESPLPTIAAVNGAAVGAGVNLALCCDVILAGTSARFDTRFLKLGLHPGGGHTWMMQRLVGSQVTKGLVLFGDVVDGTEAARLGLAYRCVEDDALLDEARALAARAAGANPELIERTKHTIETIGQLPDHQHALEHELADQVWSLGLPEFQERLRALQDRISSKP